MKSMRLGTRLLATILYCCLLQSICHAFQPIDMMAANPESSVVVASDAGRLLLETPSVIPSSIMKEIQRQRTLEDFRLAQCQDTGSNWEQCFFYGTKNVKVPETPPATTTTDVQSDSTAANNFIENIGAVSPTSASTKSKIPTW